jgi:2-iminobutanoate/2-iminopropanoate deaminase
MASFPASRTALLAFLALSNVALAQDTRRYIEPRTAADSSRPPYSGAVQIGNTLYLSGDTGVDGTETAPLTTEAEARAVLDRIAARLKAAGFSMDDLVFVQVFCSDVSHYDTFNRVYRTYFKREFPARAFLGSGTLLFNARYEVQGIAVKR